MAVAEFSPADLTVFLDAVVGLVEPADVWFLWSPQLRDPGDELVLEAAVNAQADAIATFNRRDFRAAAGRFGIDILLPAEAIRRVP
jgi:predicted nucleic acid-binding protein